MTRRLLGHMLHGLRIGAVIPALNEAEAIGKVLDDLPAWLDRVVVADNGSTDGTGDAARRQGVRVVREEERGYGAACQRGVAALGQTDVVVFLDGDYSDHPQEARVLVDPIVYGEADLVIGSRVLGQRQPGALTPQARFGNWLACSLMRLLWRTAYTDLGPFRAIRTSSLNALGMEDRDFGWTVEMQAKAARAHLRVLERPVRYRRRIGRSKISGTLQGVLAAGTKILYTIGREALRETPPASPRREAALLFTRYPVLGEVKTRLASEIGEQGALKVHRGLAAYVSGNIRRLRQRRPGVDIQVWYTGGDAERMASWLGPDLSYYEQPEGDLGARMDHALRQAFAQGCDRALIVGSDCPDADEEVLALAFEALERTGAVLGPATDGGYYLLGLNRPCSALFQGIDWGTETVRAQTESRAAEAGLRFELLPEKRDVDRPEELPAWRERVKRTFRPAAPRISVVVPALNEERHIGNALASARGDGVELILVDGGSEDATAKVARSYGAKAFRCEPGRAVQMNAGASVAAGEVLLFLHADTVLPPGYADEVEDVLAESNVVAGAFRLGIDSRRVSLRAVEAGTNWRSRRGMPYGDQALFLYAEDFHALGGFPDVPILEDYLFVRALRREGRVALAPSAVATSSRRWDASGPLALTLKHQLILAGRRLGLAPRLLARLR